MQITSFLKVAFKFLTGFIIYSLLIIGCSESSTENASSDSSISSNDVSSDGNNNSQSPEPANDAPQPESMTSLKQDEKVYAWVDQLNIRDAANTSGKRVTSATEQEALGFTGEKSNNPEAIVLRGVAYHEPWLKVKTKDGKEGWVFGGAVKRQNETKGNGPINDEQFFYPHFGRFDLNTWKKESSTDGGGGDAESNTAVYTKNGRTLDITKTDVGEYGYHREYKLTDNDGQILKTRKFSLEADIGEMTLTETVNVYSSTPATKYTRTQKLGKHFMQLNARPVMVNGAWKDGPADPLPVAPESLSIGATPDDCPTVDENDGCSTNFDFAGSQIFKADTKNACMNLNGKTVALTYVNFEGEHMRLYKQSFDKNWIVLNEKGDDLIFGKKLEMGSKYDDHRAEMIQTLLVMDEMPTEIPYQSNGTVGMGYRAEVRDMCSEAITMAKAAKMKGESGPPEEFKYQNDEYLIHFKVRSTGTDDGGGNDYKGTMEVRSKNGKLLGTKQVTGYSGC